MEINHVIHKNRSRPNQNLIDLGRGIIDEPARRPFTLYGRRSRPKLQNLFGKEEKSCGEFTFSYTRAMHTPFDASLETPGEEKSFLQKTMRRTVVRGQLFHSKAVRMFSWCYVFFKTIRYEFGSYRLNKIPYINLACYIF